MLDMGFQPQVDEIVNRIPADRQTMFFSATLAGKILDVAKRYTRDARRHADVRVRRRPGRSRTASCPSSGDRVEALVDLLAGEAPRSLVFVARTAPTGWPRS